MSFGQVTFASMWDESYQIARPVGNVTDIDRPLQVDVQCYDDTLMIEAIIHLVHLLPTASNPRYIDRLRSVYTCLKMTIPDSIIYASLKKMHIWAYQAMSQTCVLLQASKYQTKSTSRDTALRATAQCKVVYCDLMTNEQLQSSDKSTNQMNTQCNQVSD